jgi:hypothetical protein
VSSREEVDLAGSRGTAHFALKWARDAKHQASLQVIMRPRATLQAAVMQSCNHPSNSQIDNFEARTRSDCYALDLLVCVVALSVLTGIDYPHLAVTTNLGWTDYEAPIYIYRGTEDHISFRGCSLQVITE